MVMEKNRRLVEKGLLILLSIWLLLFAYIPASGFMQEFTKVFYHISILFLLIYIRIISNFWRVLINILIAFFALNIINKIFIIYDFDISNWVLCPIIIIFTAWTTKSKKGKRGLSSYY